MRRLGPDEWTKLLAEYEASGLMQKEFAAKHDVSMNTLQYWLYKRGKRPSSDSGSLTKFLPVELVPSPALSARADAGLQVGVVVELPTGIRLHVASSTPPRYVAELLAALR